MEELMPGQKAYVGKKKGEGCVEIAMYSKHWPCLLPQHGPGRKHDRLIELESWQEDLVIEEPQALIRGLIHSDGCGVMSVRYHCSNMSEDIKDIFCGALDLLEIPWTRPDDRGIAIYRKSATARLDEFVGPKY